MLPRHSVALLLHDATPCRKCFSSERGGVFGAGRGGQGRAARAGGRMLAVSAALAPVFAPGRGLVPGRLVALGEVLFVQGRPAGGVGEAQRIAGAWPLGGGRGRPERRKQGESSGHVRIITVLRTSYALIIQDLGAFGHYGRRGGQ